MKTECQMERNTEEENHNHSKCNPITPLSPSSSPNHDFSFSTSLHQPSNIPNTKNESPPPFAVDLSPADKIFFHGHLLPLHDLSNLPVFPCSSADSFDSFTLPIKEKTSTSTTSTDQEHISIDHHISPTSQESSSSVLREKVTPWKPRSFFSFVISKKRKGCDEKDDQGSQEADQEQKSKPKFDFKMVVRRYMRLMNPFLSSRNRGMDPQYFRRQTYSSFSGNSPVRKMKGQRGRRGEFSAPASMCNSPTNSGLLAASGTATPTASDHSTMEELHAAIQSAIAHCKKSTAAEDKIHVK